ncbi:MAG: hypothetical protein WDN48_08010 [Pseudolabrys sp.]
MAAEPTPASSATSIRETIDLLELDLSAMIREVAAAAASVRGGASASAEALAAIRARTESLAAKSQDAKRDADQVAGATVELAQSASEIDQQVRVAVRSPTTPARRRKPPTAASMALRPHRPKSAKS